MNGMLRTEIFNNSSKVNPMKHTLLMVSAMFVLVSPVSILAEQQSEAEQQPDVVVVSEAQEGSSNNDAPCPMHGKGMMHKGMGQHGMGHEGMMHGKGKHQKHEDVVRRLDMIEARMARIEAMLEALMRR
jgi:hypothetical protein